MNLSDFDILFPVKVDSSRLQNKMTRRFAGSSLLEVGLSSLIRNGAQRERIYIYSTSDESVIDCVEGYQVSFLYEPQEIVETDGVYELMEDVCSRAPFSSGKPFVMYKAINPLFNAFQEAIDKWEWLQEEVSFGFDSLAVIHRLRKYVLKKIDHDLGSAAGFVTVGWSPGNHKVSQNINEVFQLAFDFIITTSEASQKSGWYYFNIPFYVTVDDQFVDIDTYQDFVAAEAMYKSMT